VDHLVDQHPILGKRLLISVYADGVPRWSDPAIS
jgi:hypothetical protein